MTDGCTTDIYVVMPDLGVLFQEEEANDGAAVWTVEHDVITASNGGSINAAYTDTKL